MHHHPIQGEGRDDAAPKRHSSTVRSRDDWRDTYLRVFEVAGSRLYRQAKLVRHMLQQIILRRPLWTIVQVNYVHLWCFVGRWQPVEGFATPAHDHVPFQYLLGAVQCPQWTHVGLQWRVLGPLRKDADRPLGIALVSALRW